MHDILTDQDPKPISYRLLEILPATLSLGTFAAMTIFSFTQPVAVASFVLAYILYWFSKSFVMSVHLIASYRAYRRAIATNWRELLDTNPHTHKEWPNIWHLVVIATYKEELPILDATLQAVRSSAYPVDRIIILLATEERDKERATANAQALEKKFGKNFGHFFVTSHPAATPGETAGKGSNISFAAKQTLPKLAKLGIKSEDVLVTTLDADNRVHPQFFAALTHTYLTAENRGLKSYQPLPMFFNNIWFVPLLIRLISVGSSFWQMIEATRPHRLRNFSAHSQSLSLLTKTNFWSVKTIVEDGHQYWRTLFAIGGRHEVVPIFVPIYQDAVLSPNGHLMTYREQYLQKQRWAWGVSDIPFVFINLWRKRHTLPTWTWLQGLRLLEGHYSWATGSLMLAFFGWLPTFVNPEFKDTALSFHFAVVYHRLLTIAMSGMVISLIIARLLLPPRPKRSLHQNDWVEWLVTPLVLPIGNIAFGSFPAIDAQIRLARGKYLGFRVTEKATQRDTEHKHS